MTEVNSRTDMWFIPSNFLKDGQGNFTLEKKQKGAVIPVTTLGIMNPLILRDQNHQVTAFPFAFSSREEEGGAFLWKKWWAWEQGSDSTYPALLFRLLSQLIMQN